MEHSWKEIPLALHSLYNVLWELLNEEKQGKFRSFFTPKATNSQNNKKQEINNNDENLPSSGEKS